MAEDVVILAISPDSVESHAGTTKNKLRRLNVKFIYLLK